MNGMLKQMIFDVFDPLSDSGKMRDKTRGRLVDALWVGEQLLNVAPRGCL